MRPADVEEIVTAYGAVLAEPSALGSVRDLRSLPYSKEDIKTALMIALKVTVDAAIREHLKVGYISLADFQMLSDSEVRSLQLWDNALSSSKSAAADALFHTVAAEGDVAIAVMRRVADEAGVLATELKAAGFWHDSTAQGARRC
jgi:NADPH-dependent ferric siderophore reductase